VGDDAGARPDHPRRRRMTKIVAGVAVLAALVVAGVLVAGGGGEGENPRSRAVTRPAAEPLANAACSPVTYAGDGRPSGLIVLSTMLQGNFQSHGIQAAQAVKLVLAQHGWRAGSHAIGLQVCDEVPYGSDESDPRKCARTARAAAENPAVLGVIGPWSSSCASLLTILNGADGPVALVSPSATYLGLTRTGPGVVPGDPERYAPSRERNFTRVVPADDVQAAAAIAYAQRVGARRLFVLDDGGLFGIGLAGGIRESARRGGLMIVGSARWDPAARHYVRQAERVRRAGADVAYLAGYASGNSPRLIADLRHELGDDLLIIGPDGFAAPEVLVRAVGAAADDFVFTIATVPAQALPPGGRRFADEFEGRFGAAPCCFAVQSAQAMEVLLRAIAASDGTRADVTRAVLDTSVKGGALGDFRFDAAGDTTRNVMGVFEVRGGRGRFVEAIEPPPDLLPRD
jgi:branched-chain amino acid transport system substrate-binding protein